MKRIILAAFGSGLIAIGIVTLPSMASATMGIRGFLWFTETLVLDRESVDGGVTIKTDSWGDDGLVNEGAEPFYIVSKAPRKNPGLIIGRHKDTFPEAAWIPVGLPEEYVPSRMLVSGQVHRWDWTKNLYSKEPAPISPWDLTGYEVVTPIEAGFPLDGAYRQVLSARRRPLLQMPPDAQDFTFEGYYRGQLLYGRGTIIYKLPLRAKAVIAFAAGAPTLLIIMLIERSFRKKRAAAKPAA